MPKSFAIVGLVFTGKKGSIPAASTIHFVVFHVYCAQVLSGHRGSW
jgi:hypothetical protein